MSGPSLRCSSCGFENAPGIKFCGECGRRLGTSPSERLDPRAYTPRHLAEKILTARTALEGERKQVTVLFADVKGSMELAERLDPEEWHGIMDRFFQLLAEGVHRFEGTVNQYTGDGIMALFGAPIAHEDHAWRACWAALHLGEALRRYADELRMTRGINFSVRTGLNSGEVVVGRIGDDLRMDYTAQGHTVGLAQRTEQLAEPGKIYLSEHTARLVTGFFRLRDLGRLTVKGVAEPVRVHELEGTGALRTRLDVSRARGFSRFVGRADEMAALEAALERALAGNGQVIAVVAEPGIGKSRLCFEFLERCRRRGLATHEAHGVAHGKLIPFLPILDMLRSYFGIIEQDGAPEARRKIAGTLLLLDESFREALPLVFDFLGVPDPTDPAPRVDPEVRQRQLLGVLRRLTEARSRREPAVILFEDLHWIDGGTEIFVANLVETLWETRTLLLVNFRPEYHADWLKKPYCRQLPLLPLGPDVIRELLADLLGAHPSLAGLAERIQERTGGNPFFIEETVQALVEGGSLEGTRGAYRLVRPAAELALPATVQAVLAARIDRLPEREKTVLQTAAVIGREFTEPVLARVVELPASELAAALAALGAAELVYEQALYPDAEYAFKHPLTQEVAYRSQLGERRARVHAAVARAIEAAYPARLDEHAALLAHHCERAGEGLAAAEWHRRAAEWAGARDRREMVRHWRQALALLRELPESPEALALGVVARTRILHNAILIGETGEDPAVLFAEGMDLAARLGGVAARVMLLVEYGMTRTSVGAVEESLGHLKEAVRLADEEGDRVVRFRVRPPFVAALNVAGRLREAIAVAEEAEALCEGDGDLGADATGFSPFGVSLTHRALVLAQLGRLAEAEHQIERALEIARRRKDAEVAILGNNLGAIVAEFAGDSDRMLSRARQATELLAVTAEGLLHAGALAALGNAHLAAQEWPEAIAALERAADIRWRRRAGVPFAVRDLAALAEAYCGAGAIDRARETADHAVALGRERSVPTITVRAHLARARVLLALGPEHAERVEADLRDAMELVETTGARAYTPQVHVERARLAGIRGDDATRRRELAEAHRLFTEIGATGWAERVARELGR
jgi:class 3 adenylate cyclase/tetratricopeptide (TPR) repeat protein